MHGVAVVVCAGLATGTPGAGLWHSASLWREVAAPTPAKPDALIPGVKPMEAPEVAQAVAAAVGAEFLSADEAKDLRVFHGLATEADLDTPARIAADALIRGRWADPIFDDAAAPALDRAEALVARGEPAAALALVGEAAAEGEPVRAGGLRVMALDLLGRVDDAVRAAAPALVLVNRGSAERALDAAWAVRAAAVAVRLRPREGAGEYGAMLGLLRHAREQVDPLCWPVLLEEARLLADKDNPAQAQEVMGQVLERCPASAGAWRLLGEMAAASFDMPSVEAIAARLDVIAGDAPGSGKGADACALRCRAMLRQSEATLAREALGAALEATPHAPDLLALEAAAVGISFDAAALEERLAAFGARIPGSARALHEAGKALSEARQYAMAGALLERAIAKEPGWAEPKIDLGLMLVQAGEDERARAVLEDATRLDPFHVRAGNSLALVRSIAGYARIESAHFVVRYQPGRTADGGPLPEGEDPDALVAAEMVAVLEENHRLVASAPEVEKGGLDHAPARKTFIDLMPDHRAFAVRIAGMPKIHTIAASTGPVIAMEAPREGASHSGTYDWPRVVRHEYTHTVGLDKTSNRIPHWFTEAQAVFLERRERDEQTCRLLATALELDRLFDFSEINIAFVRPRKPTDRQQGYAQGHWMYEYLYETHGARAPLELMGKYAAGVREEEAYRDVLGVSRAEFLGRFKAWARGRVRAWGLLPAEGVPTMPELLEQVKGEVEKGGQVPAAVVERWLKEHPAHPDVLELALDRAIEANNGEPTEEMTGLIDRYAAARPVDPKPHRLMARLALAAGASAGVAARAAGALEFLDEREEKIAAYAARLAEMYAEEGDAARGLVKAERATRIAPYDARLRELAARVALVCGKPGAARGHIRMLVALEPGQAVHRRRLAAVEALVEKAGE